MKNIAWCFLISFSFLITQSSIAATFNAATSIVSDDEEKKTEKLKVKITGMTCGGCANNIHNVLINKEGFISDDLSYPGDIATVVYDPTKLSEKDILKAIKKAGYEAKKIMEEVSK